MNKQKLLPNAFRLNPEGVRILKFGRRPQSSATAFLGFIAKVANAI